MIHHGDIIEQVNTNIEGRALELTEPIVFYGNLVEEVIKDGLPLFTARYVHVDRNLSTT
jgi:hypothetical protein